jgi:hypothetical protein
MARALRRFAGLPMEEIPTRQDNTAQRWSVPLTGSQAAAGAGI